MFVVITREQPEPRPAGGKKQGVTVEQLVAQCGHAYGSGTSAVEVRQEWGHAAGRRGAQRGACLAGRRVPVKAQGTKS